MLSGAGVQRSGTPAESKHPYRLSDSCDGNEFLGLCVHSRYEVTRLLYGESYDDVHKALAREKQLKGWSRAKKVALIVRRNPHWVELAAEWYRWMRSAEGRDASTPQ